MHTEKAKKVYIKLLMDEMNIKDYSDEGLNEKGCNFKFEKKENAERATKTFEALNVDINGVNEDKDGYIVTLNKDSLNTFYSRTFHEIQNSDRDQYWMVKTAKREIENIVNDSKNLLKSNYLTNTILDLFDVEQIEIVNDVKLDKNYIKKMLTHYCLGLGDDSYKIKMEDLLNSQPYDFIELDGSKLKFKDNKLFNKFKLKKLNTLNKMEEVFENSLMINEVNRSLFETSALFINGDENENK